MINVQGSEVQGSEVQGSEVQRFWGSPVKFAALLFCEKFNWASRVQEIIVNKQRLIINN
jgi:hypothetical protein